MKLELQTLPLFVGLDQGPWINVSEHISTQNDRQDWGAFIRFGHSYNFRFGLFVDILWGSWKGVGQRC